MSSQRISLQTLLVVAILLTILHKSSTTNLLNGGQIVEQLQTVAFQALGVGEIQHKFDEDVQWQRQEIDGSVYIERIVQQLQHKLQARFGLVQNLKEIIEDRFIEFSSSPHVSSECCHVQRSEYISSFHGEVDMSSMCHRRSQFAESSAKFAPSFLQERFETNIAIIPTIKWQYFGSEDGVLFMFPGVSTDDCDEYDPRFRPWYVETASRTPKDVVIVVDKSGSMSTIDRSGSKSRMTLAKEAAKTVIDTLNPKDRVTAIAFSDLAYPARTSTFDGVSDDCFISELAMATPLNREYLRGYVDTMEPTYDTMYTRALNMAYDLLIEAQGTGSSDSQRNQLILFLSDGDPSPSDPPRAIYDMIRTKNALSGSQINLLTFGIGSSITSQGRTILETMASEEYGNGLFIHLSDPWNIRGEMSRYYTFYAEEMYQTPVISTPYYDAFGIGLVTTISYPIYWGSSLVGVAGMDLAMTDLLSPVMYSQLGQDSYTFVVDGQGWTLQHPHYPQPHSVTQDPTHLEIQYLEHEASVADVLDSMKSGGAGRKGVMREIRRPKGENYRGSVTSDPVPVYYNWRNVEGTNFSVCLVVRQGQVKMSPTPFDFTSGNAYNIPITYHRADLMNPVPATCKHFMREAVLESTVVKFGAQCFVDPFAYLDREEDDQHVANYMDELRGERDGDIFKDGVIDSVILTALIEPLWFGTLPTSLSWDTAQYCVWRYFATADGVIRISPGVSLHKNYDPSQRPWYTMAAGLSPSVAVSAPYLDSFGAGYVITLSQAVLPASATYSTGDVVDVAGVMGVDFTINYFYYMLMEAYEICEEDTYICFALDQEGYFVVHEEFVTVTGQESPLVENVHVTVKEKELAKNLIDRGFLEKEECYNVMDLKKMNYYKMTLMSSVRVDLDSWFYELHRVSGYNLYVGVMTRSYGYADCDCQDPHSLTPPACSSHHGDCQCPCEEPLTDEFQDCQNVFDIGHDWETCFPDPPPVDLSTIETTHTDGPHNLCLDPQCSTKTSDTECYMSAGCSWCVRDSSGGYLEEAYCTYQELCYFGQDSYNSPYLFLESYLEQFEITDEVIFYIGVGVLVLFVIVTGCVCRACKRRHRNRNSGNTATTTETQELREQPKAPRPSTPPRERTPPKERTPPRRSPPRRRSPERGLRDDNRQTNVNVTVNVPQTTPAAPQPAPQPWAYPQPQLQYPQPAPPPPQYPGPGYHAASYPPPAGAQYTPPSPRYHGHYGY